MTAREDEVQAQRIFGVGDALRHDAARVRIALFFKVVEGTEWPDVDPRVVLGFDYSAGGPWQENVAIRLEAYPDLIPPEPGGGAGCGV